MNFSLFHLTLSGILIFLTFNSINSVNVDPNLHHNDWKLVKKGWPISDKEDVSPKQFHYNTDTLKREFSLNQTFIGEISNDLIQPIKLRLKYWSFTENKTDRREFRVYRFDHSDANRIAEIDTYNKFYYGKWMAREYQIHGEELQTFGIEFASGELGLTALKDLQVEYVVQSREIATQTQTNDFHRFQIPPQDLTLSKDYLYFYNCKHTCKVSFERSNYLQTDEQIDKISISFNYWSDLTEMSTVGVFSDHFINNNTSENKWLQFDKTYLRDEINLENLIHITLNGNSGFAINNLKITCSVINNIGVQRQFHLSLDQTSNELTYDENSFWSDKPDWSSSHGPFYFPTKPNNLYKIDLDFNTSCYAIEYFVSGDRKTVLNVKLNAENDLSLDTILSIKPKLRETSFQRSQFCLRDFIAIDYEKIQLSFSVEKENFSSGVNGFAMKGLEIIPNTNPDYNNWNIDTQSQSFLRHFKDQTLLDIKTEWISQIPDSGLFTFTKLIHFKGNADSRFPYSAQVMSKWIKYDPKLFDKIPRFSISVTDEDLFDFFTVTPKLCDSLSFCREADVFEIKSISDPKSKIYDFPFIQSDHLKYVKLVFYVEYFISSKNTSDKTPSKDIEFDLELLNFGDPCYEPENAIQACPANSICTNNVKSLSLTRICECDSKYTGQFCNETNHCSTRAASIICGADRLKCINKLDYFKCACDSGSDINWDLASQKCVAPAQVTTVWTKEGDFYKHHISSPLISQPLIIEFNDIENLKHDVCLDLSYETLENVTLSIKYFEDNKLAPKELFDYIILGKDDIQFCLLDFVHSYSDYFSISITVISNSQTWADSFRIKYATTVQRLMQDTVYVPYLMNWNHEEFEFEKYISSVSPISLFRENNTDNTLTLTFPDVHNISNAYIFTKWIENHTSFGQTANKFRNYYKYKIDKSPNYQGRFEIIPHICYIDGQFKCDAIRLPSNDISPSPGSPLFHYQSNFDSLGMTDRPFKIMFKINRIKLDSVKIEFTTLNFGDICEKAEACHERGICQTIIPNDNNYICNCQPDFGGLQCQFNDACKQNYSTLMTNEEYCQSQPGYENEHNCFTVLNNQFECACPEMDYIWNTSVKRCVRNPHIRRIIECKDTNCPFLYYQERNLGQIFNWSHPNFPQITSLEDNILPFYYSEKANSDISISVTGLNPDQDACFKFRYYVTHKSILNIKHNTQQLLKINPFFSNENTIGWSDREQKFCIKNLIYESGSDFRISFSGEYSSGEEMVAIKLLPISSVNNGLIEIKNKTTAQSIPYIIQNNIFATNEDPVEHKFHNQWTLGFPSERWEISQNSVTLKDTFTKNKKTAYYMSHWIKSGAKDLKFRTKVKEHDSNGHFKHFSLQISAYNSKMEKLGDSGVYTRTDIENGTTTDYITVPINEYNQVFRIAVNVVYDKMHSTGVEDSVLTLGPMDLGDGCVHNEKGILSPRDCNYQSMNGECKRLGQPMGYDCACNQEFNITKDCTERNYCFSNLNHINSPNIGALRDFTGVEFCESIAALSCIPGTVGDLPFRCECRQNDFWNYQKRNCTHWPKCPTLNCPDYITEKCVEPLHDDKGPECECREGYVRKVAGSPCVKYNPCDDKSQVCGVDPNVECVNLDDPNRQYDCYCRLGYIAIGIGNNTECISDHCKYPDLNKCQQNCKQSSDKKSYECGCFEGYRLMEDKHSCQTIIPCPVCKGKAYCDHLKGGKCECPKGYKLKATLDDCELDVKGFDGNTNELKNYCFGGELTADSSGHLSCKCSEHYELNVANQVCVLKSLCGAGEPGRQQCSERSAKCHMNSVRLGEVECECPIGQIFSNGQTVINPNTSQSHCIDVCDHLKFESQCSTYDGKCNPLKLINQNMNPSNAIPWHTFCDCPPGYYMDNTYGCLLARQSTKFNLIIKNSYPIPKNYSLKPIVPEYQLYRSQPNILTRNKRQLYTDDRFGLNEARKREYQLNSELDQESNSTLLDYYIIDLMETKAREILSQTNLIDSYKSIKIKKCTPYGKDNEFYDCEVVITHNNQRFNLTDTKAALMSECETIPSINHMCLYIQNNLVVQRDTSFQFIKNEHCSDATTCPKYSDCISDKSDDYFQCLCGQDFHVKRNTTLRTEGYPNSGKHLIQRCEPIDYCTPQLCATNNHRVCIQEEAKLRPNSTSSYYVPHNCPCSEGYFENEHKQCMDACNCGSNGRCEMRGNVRQCVCNSGWSGAQCDSEYSTAGNGGWIAGIVILAVLVVIATGLALYFAKKSRSSSSFTGNSNQMSEYPRRFEDNPSFHRE